MYPLFCRRAPFIANPLSFFQYAYVSIDKVCCNYSYFLKGSVVCVCLYFCDLVNDIHSIDHFPKNGVQRVEVVVVYEIDEELTSSRVWTSVCHGNSAPFIFVGIGIFILYRGY